MTILRNLWRVVSPVLRDLWRVLWACRVSVASVLLGFFLFIFAAPVRDLFFDQRATAGGNVAFWAVFFLLLPLGWALPVHYSARRVLDNPAWIRRHEAIDDAEAAAQRRRSSWAIVWLPRVLGVGCYLAVLLGLVLAQYDLPASIAAEVPEVAAAKFQFWMLMAATLATGAGFTAFLILRRARTTLGTRAGIVYLAAASIPLVVIALFPSLADRVPRAPLLMLMLGAWVPPLSLLAIGSHYARMPLILAAALLFAVVAFVIGDDHDVSRIATGSQEEPQLAFDQAVARWKQANGCAGAGEPCPVPIVVIGSGGAIRAAFYTASALGILMDATCTGPREGGSRTAGTDGCDRRPLLVDRVFAISSVSGSGLAAASLSAALPYMKPDGGPPCTIADRAGLWVGGDRVPASWRECLQLLVTGDYLSPVAVAAVFRDLNPFFKGGPDRAQVLEEALARRFRAVLGLTDEAPSTFSTPFSAFAPDEGEWSPLLIMNGTSVDTGRRILTSHLSIDDQGSRVFADSFDFDELSHSDVADLPGVSLATAITNTARFPVVSPHATIRVDGAVRDRLVDGGYLENFGALTAIEIVEKLQSGYGFAPLVLVVTNEPEEDVPLCDLARPQRPPLPRAGGSIWLSWLSAPISAILSTRTARGTLALARLRQLTPPQTGEETFAERANRAFRVRRELQNGPLARFAYVRVVGEAIPGPALRAARRQAEARGEIPGDPAMQAFRTEARLRELSASWWASKAIQAILDRSLRSPENIWELQRVCRVLGNAGDASRCVARLDALRIGPPHVPECEIVTGPASGREPE